MERHLSQPERELLREMRGDLRVRAVRRAGMLLQPRQNAQNRRWEMRSPRVAKGANRLAERRASEERVALGQGQDLRGLATQKFTIGPDLVSFRVDADFRKRIVPTH